MQRAVLDRDQLFRAKGLPGRVQRRASLVADTAFAAALLMDGRMDGWAQILAIIGWSCFMMGSFFFALNKVGLGVRRAAANVCVTIVPHQGYTAVVHTPVLLSSCEVERKRSSST